MHIGVLPTTFHLGIRYELNQSAHANTTENRLFSEPWFKDLALTLFDRADRHPSLQVVRLSLTCSHFTKNSHRELSLIDFHHDTTLHNLTRQTQKVREKYGPDILRWGGEM
jgi:DNA polymerase-4